DGNPRECSERVRAWAYAALAHCLACYCETSVEAPPEIKKEGGEEPKPLTPEGEPRPGLPETLPAPTTQVNPVDYYRRAATTKREQLIEDARRLLERRTSFALPAAAPVTGRSLTDIVSYALGSNGSATTTTPGVVEKPLVEKSVVEKPLFEKPLVEKPAAEKPLTPVTVNERPAFLSPPVEKPVAPVTVNE